MFNLSKAIVPYEIPSTNNQPSAPQKVEIAVPDFPTSFINSYVPPVTTSTEKNIETKDNLTNIRNFIKSLAPKVETENIETNNTENTDIIVPLIIGGFIGLLLIRRFLK